MPDVLCVVPSVYEHVASFEPGVASRSMHTCALCEREVLMEEAVREICPLGFLKI